MPRRASLSSGSVIFPVITAAVVFILAWTGHGVPCIFRQITGWQCPGCGITTLFLSLLKGNIPAAFAANPFLFCTLPLLAAALLFFAYRRKTGRPLRGACNAFLAVYLAGLLIFGVLRNLLP